MAEQNGSTTKMVVNKETKGAIRYAPEGDSTVGNIYIRKEGLPSPWPESIVVTIHYGEVQ